MFKKGDEVRLVSKEETSREFGYIGKMLRVGEVGTIGRVGRDGGIVIENCLYSPKDLELVREENKQESVVKFKVGDRVKLIGNFSGSSNRIGDVGEVVEVTGDIEQNLRVSVEGRSQSSNWSYGFELELVENEQEKNMNVNYIVTPTGITVSFEGKLESISEGDHRYSQVLAAIKSGNLEAIPELVDVQKSFDALENVELVGGRVKINGQDIPEVVSDRVLKFKEQGLPFEPLVKFAEKLQRNPSFNSRQMLYKFLERNEHPITKDGNFIAYKKVRSDFTDCHTGTVDNSIGKVVEMPRQEVDDNPDNTCSSGLHVAAYNYAKGFSSGHLMLIEVNPEDVVAVPNDYNGEKMRVCKYEVKEICESRLESDYYGDSAEDSPEDSDENSVEDFWGNKISVGDFVTVDGGSRVEVLKVDNSDDTVLVAGDFGDEWYDGNDVELE